MGLFKKIGEKYTEYKFKSNGWNIIQSINADKLKQIIDNYESEGWEITDSYTTFTPQIEKWGCKLRKGQISLQCDWNHDSLGQIIGVRRVIVPLAKQYKLMATESPK